MAKKKTVVEALETVLARFQMPSGVGLYDLVNAVAGDDTGLWSKMRDYIVYAHDPGISLYTMGHKTTVHQQHIALCKAIQHAKRRHLGGFRTVAERKAPIYIVLAERKAPIGSRA